jgi:hypothetical protein
MERFEDRTLGVTVVMELRKSTTLAVGTAEESPHNPLKTGTRVLMCAIYQNRREVPAAVFLILEDGYSSAIGTISCD